MKINKYPDGSSYVTVPNSVKITPTFRINTYEDLWHLNQYVDAIKNQIGGIIPEVTIPWLIDGQADRRFAKNQSSGLKLVCNFLNSMDARFRIFHPHNPEVVEALLDRVKIIDNTELIKKVLNNLSLTKNLRTVPDFDPLSYASYSSFPDRCENLHNNLILMSSDAGGFKPLMKLCDAIKWKGETYSASKARTDNGMVQVVDRQDFGGKDILIIDDICVYGGTFKGLAKMLRERNVGKLYLAVSHMTVQNLGRDNVCKYFNKVFTTNSKYDNYNVNGTTDIITNLEIINLF